MIKIFPYSLTIIKPDAHRDVLAEMIAEDLQTVGFSIVFRKDIALSKEQAEKIYSEYKDNPNFEFAVKSLLGTGKNKFNTFLILKLTKGGDALEKIQEIKGKSDEGGVRLKYRLLSRQELEQRDFKDDEFKNELAKNRLHVPDSIEKELEIADMLLTENEKQDIKEREPEFYKELDELRKNKEVKSEFLEHQKIKFLK